MNRNCIIKSAASYGPHATARTHFSSTLRAALIATIAVIVVFALTSCFEYAEEYTFNPDGSGTFSMDIGMGAMLASMMELGDSMGEGFGMGDTSSETDATGGDAETAPGETPSDDESATVDADEPGDAENPDETEAVDDSNPFKQMQAEADRINKEGDPSGLITSAEFKQYDEGDMKHSSFTVTLSDMTKAIDAVEGEWWADAPGAGMEGDPNKIPFKIEKLENGNLLFTKEIAVPDANNVIPYPEGESGETAEGGADTDSNVEGADTETNESTESETTDKGTESGDVIGMLSLTDTAYAEEEKDKEKAEDKEAAKEDEEKSEVDMEKELNDLMEGLGSSIAEGLKEGSADLGLTEGEDGATDGEGTSPEGTEDEAGMEGADMDAFGAEMAKQMFAGKNYTITIHAPIIVSSNGTVIEPETDIATDSKNSTSKDTPKPKPNAKPEMQTVQWVIPMADMMSGDGFYMKCTAEIKLREKSNPIQKLVGLFKGGETEEDNHFFPIIMGMMTAVIVALLICVGVLKRRIKTRK